MVLGGLGHSAFTPAAYDGLTEPAMWFLSAGLMMIFLGFLNLSMAQTGGRKLTLSILTQLANIVTALFLIPLQIATGAAQPYGLLLLVGIAFVAGASTMRQKGRSP
jgi:hypothetical protein